MSPASAGGFSTTVPPGKPYCLFDSSFSDRCKVVSLCGFDLHFHYDIDVEHLFMCLLPSVCLLWENVYSGPLPIFQSGCLFF